MVTVLHLEHLGIPRALRGFTRSRHDGGLRSTLLRELKMVTVLHFEHLGGALEVEQSWKF